MNRVLEEIIDEELEANLDFVHALRSKYLYGKELVSGEEFEEALDEAIELGAVDLDQLRVTNYRISL